MILEFAPLAIWPVVMASLSEAHALRPADLVRGTRLYFRLLFVLVVPLALTGSVLGGETYRVMYGAGMDPGAPICRAFFLVFMIGFFAAPLRMALFVRERPVTNMWIGGVGALINIDLDLALIPTMGMWGAVWAVAVALAVSGVLQYWAARRALPELGDSLGLPAARDGRLGGGAARLAAAAAAGSSASAPGGARGRDARPVPGERALRVFGEEERRLLLRSGLPLKPRILRLLGLRPAGVE